MELKAFTPEQVRSSTFAANEIRVMPISDIQYIDPESSDVERLKKYIRWGMKKKVYFLGLGDYIDTASPSNRAIVRDMRSRAYDSVRKMIDTAANEVLGELYDVLEPTTGRWLGVLKGHHYWEFEKGETSDAVLARKLHATLLGHCAFIGLRFKGTGQVAWIWAHHGAGGGITPGSALNRLRPIVENFRAHVYVMGHQHKTSVLPMPWVEPAIDAKGHPTMIGSKRLLVSVGGFLRGYMQGNVGPMGEVEGSYVEQKMLPPTQLGSVVLKFRLVEEDAGPRIDVGVELP